MDRVIPIIHRIKKNFDTIISVDTSDSAVMKEAINNGAEIINDVYALKNIDALDFLSEQNKAICLMHMKGTPLSMQENPVYDDLITEVKIFLEDRLNYCLRVGISRESLIVDPGFGFGKTLMHNILLLKNIEQLKYLKVPICVGISRKSFIGKITNKSINKRIHGSLGATLMALQNGANIIRTHDVGPTQDIINVYNSLNNI
jgi:dihydropteroate synthase